MKTVKQGAMAKTSAGERGQALVETVIVLPIMLFIVLGGLQLMLVAHGRIMTEYAAYAAARAGIVHNANWHVMRNAATFSVLPLYHRTDDLPHLLAGWAKVKAVSEATAAVDMTVGTAERLLESLTGLPVSGVLPDISLVEVRVTNPTAESFRLAKAHQQQQAQRAINTIDGDGRLHYPTDGREIDFDDIELLRKHPDLARLGVEVRVLYPLRIPIMNRLIFELWIAQMLLNAERLESDLDEWASFRGRVRGGSADGRYLDEAAIDSDGTGVFDDALLTSQWTKEVRALRDFARSTGIYLLPLKATYAMQMQSNLFETHRREPVWFQLN